MNNATEYEALIAGLDMAIAMGVQELIVYMDSQLVVEQVNGGYCAENDSMIKYLAVVNKKKAYFRDLKLFHIMRGENKLAGALAYVAALVGSERRMINIGFFERPAIEIPSITSLVCAVRCEPVVESWITPILEYLRTEKLPEDKMEARGIKERSRRYSILEGRLYRRSSQGGIWLRCLNKGEALEVMKEIHDGDFSNHSGGRSLAHKIWTQGYYWPIMQDTCKEYVQKCRKFQIHAHDCHAPAGELNIIHSPWPFVVWGMDIVGPMKEIKRNGNDGVRWMLALTDYFTKWVEAIALVSVTHEDVISFIKENNIMRFGTPYAIIMDNGSQFTEGPTRVFLDEYRINEKCAAPYYPQTNGQAESTNKTIMNNIKKKLEKKKEYWSEHLLQVLWAYRITPRTSTGETPFAMAFGMDAVLPTEVHLPTALTYMIKDGNNFGVQHFDVDTVEG